MNEAKRVDRKLKIVDSEVKTKKKNTQNIINKLTIYFP